MRSASDSRSSTRKRLEASSNASGNPSSRWTIFITAGPSASVIRRPGRTAAARW